MIFCSRSSHTFHRIFSLKSWITVYCVSNWYKFMRKYQKNNFMFPFGNRIFPYCQLFYMLILVRCFKPNSKIDMFPFLHKTVERRTVKVKASRCNVRFSPYFKFCQQSEIKKLMDRENVSLLGMHNTLVTHEICQTNRGSRDYMCAHRQKAMEVDTRYHILTGDEALSVRES